MAKHLKEGRECCVFCLEQHGVLHRPGCKCLHAHYHLECVRTWCDTRQHRRRGQGACSKDGFVICTVCKTEQFNFRRTWVHSPYVPDLCYDIARCIKRYFSCSIGPLLGGFLTESAFRLPYFIYLNTLREGKSPPIELYPTYIYGEIEHGMHLDLRQ